MKAEFALFGLMFTVEIFLNLKREASHEGEEQLMHSVKPGEYRHLCCYSSMCYETEGNTNIYLLRGNNTGYSIYKKGGKKV